jgi:hypothetical protein
MKDENIKQKAVDTFNALKSSQIATARKYSSAASSVLGIAGSALSPRLSSAKVQTTQQDLKNFKPITSKNVNTPRAAHAASEVLVNPDSYITKVLQPKKFDRVFNVIFDPEFQIDFEKTTSNKFGADTLNLLVRERKIININQNEYVDADKSLQDASLESFFVSIETHAQEYVSPLSISNSVATYSANIKNNLVSTTSSRYRK